MLKSLQRGAHIMIIEPDDEPGEQIHALEENEVSAQQAEAMLKVMNQYSKKNGFFTAKPVLDYSIFNSLNEKGIETVKQIDRITAQIQALQTRASSLENLNDALTPWLPCLQPLSEFKSTKYVRIVPGFIPTNVLEEIRAYTDSHGEALQVFAEAPEGAASIAFLYEADADEVLAGLKELGFTETSIIETSVPPQNVFDANVRENEQITQEIETLKTQLSELGASRTELELYIQQEVSKQKREQVAMTSTLDTLILTGWVRSDRIEELEKDIQKATDVYDLTISDPEKGETPPTVTKNSHFLAQFETITDMFSLPKQGSLDPAPVAGPWYWLIYGMMVSDAGYGAVMAIMLYWFKKVKKPEGPFGQLINVLYYCSFTTIFWGVMFGSYFGFSLPPILFNPLDVPMTMLIFTLVVGVLQIYSGMIIKVIESSRDGHFLDGLFDQISWMLLLTGLMMLFIPALKTVAIVMACVGAAIILFTAGRDKPTIVGKLVGGIMGLYGITSYISDILSYSRILALTLATAVVGMVMNLLAGMLATSIVGYVFAAMIFFVGHVFNIAMSMLSAYVHDSRLQYIEFFNKFYEGGGLPFTPLAINEQYVDIAGADVSQGSNAVKGDLQ